MKIAQGQRYESKDWWKWSVWIEAPAAELANVRNVISHQHPTFPDPVRESTDRGEKFRLATAAWGTFRVRDEVLMKDGRTQKRHHELELSYPDGTPADG